jgi:glycogen debranching enzyme
MLVDGRFALSRRNFFAAASTLLLAISALPAPHAGAQGAAAIPKFVRPESGLRLERRTQSGSFFDVVGRRAAVFGYENRALEAWVYPLKILDDFKLGFQVEGYPLELPGPEIAVSIDARPEATTFTYSHAAFTVRQIIFAPLDEPGIVMLLDVDSVLPLRVSGSFRPRLGLMWPGGLMTGNLGWDADAHVYSITEESQRYAGVIGSPLARDVSVMPYQEEPRDVPVQFHIDVPVDAGRANYVPIVIAGSVEGRAGAKAAYDRLLASAETLYAQTTAHYARLQADTVSIATPDERLDTALAWAKVGVDKGMATNPLLGTGFIAGFRTSGESERPGFAWFFGRDALWTMLAVTSYGDYASTRTALEFLRKFQRADGKIPHEISQSASLLPWFTDYPYAWASADATPLYVITHADLWRATGDMEFLKASWESIVKAYNFSAATDKDGNGLIENTGVGHGWVEGGALYPPHEEIYMQGVWIEASRAVAELAELMSDTALATSARTAAARTQEATERTYWLDGRGFYAFATQVPRAAPGVAEPGPDRPRRQARLNALAKATLIDEDTVLPAVPLWWRTLGDERAQSQIDHLGSGAIATEWGARIISNQSQLYDPLSYHYGSVWPLFTGWASMGAYRYGRPHVAYQALMSNALLSYANALGYVTELLSGDFNAPFGRSSHHQVWSEAMVVTPALRGLFGLEVRNGGRLLEFAPLLPADWDLASARNVPAGGARYDFTLERASGRQVITVTRRDAAGEAAKPSRVEQLRVTPSFPLDARVRSVTVNGRATRFDVAAIGDVQRALVLVEPPAPVAEIVVIYDEGSDVYAMPEAARAGGASDGLRVLRSRADASALRVTVEGLSGRPYRLTVRSPRRLGEVRGAKLLPEAGRDRELVVTFDGPPNVYTRRELIVPFLAAGR